MSTGGKWGRLPVRPGDDAAVRSHATAPAVVRYGVTLAGIAVASVLTVAFDDHLGRTILILYWPVVIGAAWFYGRGPAIVASSLAVVMTDYLFVPPVRTLHPGSTQQIFPFLTFMLVTFAISSLVNRVRESHQRMALLAEELERSAEVKTQFLTSMSHELRTPLNAIAGYADLLSLGVHGNVTEAQAQDIERIKRNQRHLLGIINDILNFARLDAGRVQFNITNFPAYDVIDDLHPMVRPQIAGRELRFDIEPLNREVIVRADRERLRQVLLNLLSNAIKFTLPGGSIRIRCHADEHVVEFAVEDTGVGIPADKLESIFEPFVQVDRSLAQPVEGTGLGLAISRDMVEGMGGSLAVRSDIGTGSTFTVSLPRAL